MSVNRNVITAGEIAESLSVSKSCAYKIMHKLNEELKTNGFYTVAGKVSRSILKKNFMECSQKKKESDKNGCI